MIKLRPDTITAGAAVITAGIAVVAIWKESRRSRFALQIDTLLKLDDKFSSAPMLELRSATAHEFLNKTYDNASNVLDFFDFVGLLTNRGALEPTMVWHDFFYWVRGYWFATRDHIPNVQSRDPTIWSDFVTLYSKLAQVEKRERQCSDEELEMSDEDVSKFLKREASLGNRGDAIAKPGGPRTLVHERSDSPSPEDGPN